MKWGHYHTGLDKCCTQNLRSKGIIQRNASYLGHGFLVSIADASHKFGCKAATLSRRRE